MKPQIGKLYKLKKTCDFYLTPSSLLKEAELFREETIMLLIEIKGDENGLHRAFYWFLLPTGQRLVTAFVSDRVEDWIEEIQS